MSACSEEKCEIPASIRNKILQWQGIQKQALDWQGELQWARTHSEGIREGVEVYRTALAGTFRGTNASPLFLYSGSSSPLNYLLPQTSSIDLCLQEQ